MNGEKLFDALTDIRDELVEFAADYKFRKKVQWQRWTALAAAFALIIGAGAYGFTHLRCGNAAPESAESESPMEGAPLYTSGYMSYAGPVLPLTALGNTGDITAVRTVSLDLSAVASDSENMRMKVTDTYVLMNTGGEDEALTLLYPVTGSLRDRQALLPELTLGEAKLETELFVGSAYSPDAEAPCSWEEYCAMLESGDYFAAAMDENTAPDIPVTVYEFRCTEVPAGETGRGEINVGYDAAGAKVMTMNFNAGTEEADGRSTRAADVRRGGVDRAWIIVLDGDVKDFEYSTEGVTVNLKKYQATLEAVLADMTEDVLGYYDGQFSGDARIVNGVTKEVYMSLIAEFLNGSGVLTDDEPAEGGDVNMLEDWFDIVTTAERVIYTSAKLVVPAGESVTVTVRSEKEPSFDYFGEKAGTSAFEVSTVLGSVLEFTEQRAEILGFENVDIVEDDFGFDIAGGVTGAVLDAENNRLSVIPRR